jgi:hypothetical protein
MPINQRIDGIAMAVGTAVIVVIVWTVAPTVLGAWRTRTLDA